MTVFAVFIAITGTACLGAGLFIGRILPRRKGQDPIGVVNTQRRIQAEADLRDVQKEHDGTTRALERQRQICNACSRCTSGGA
ncbi:hypothetical protein F4561_001192 [Lipingzhangella halophila]|uniref:Uncharacterized protein n=1 Tax=Lipingzhangella halophila TaxID=1783352 RepID=A0A7W7W0X5_9ACTN|nr:hypothetical protein [Lipingzhangella halophila]MBB4930372.1 hypothetical protein [Lipingzhangella halophila]